MSEGEEQSKLEAEIEEARTAEGYKGLNNFHSFMPGGHRYEALQAMPNFGNNSKPDKMKGKSLRQFTEHSNKVREQLGVNSEEVQRLRREARVNRDVKQQFKDYIFPVYKALRLEGFTHADCAA